MDDLKEQLAELRDQLAKLESLRGLLGDDVTDQKKAELEARIQALIETGGGAVVVGNVEAGEDFVGRDKWQLWIERLYLGQDPDQVPPEALLRAYLRALAGDCRRLPLGVVDPRFLQTSAKSAVPLSDVYVDLDVLAPVREEQEKDERAFLGRLLRVEGGERTSLLEAVAHERVTRFVLLGDAGSGKTTFVNYVAYALATAEADGASPLLPEDTPLQGMLPVRLILRDAAARCIPAEATKGEAGMLWNALQADLAARLGKVVADALFPYLQGRLLEDGGLILLDGLDEVPAAARRRQCLLEAVADLSAMLPSDGSRMVVTARPYADPAWRLSDFETLVLAPFSDEQVERFVTRWYRAVRPAMGWDEGTAQERRQRLVDALAERPYLADLAARPLLLTLMATLHTSWGQLPEDRADLYEETVKLLLSRWQRAREVKGPDGETVVGPGIAQVLAVDEGHLRTALHRMALRAHERQGKGEEREARPADIGEEETLLALLPLFKAGVDPARVLRYLETRAGLLVGRAPGVYAFPHRSFQEYLAACHLADEAEFAAELRERVWADPDWWQEVFLLGVGKAKQGGLGNAVHVVNTLVPAGPEEIDERSERHWQAAALAGQALVDLRFPKEAEDKPSFEAVLKRVRRWLVDLLGTPDVLTPRERAEAGDVLGKLGDPRPGVGVVPPPPPAGEGPGVGALPDILLVEVPAGPFLMGSAEDDEMAYDDEHPRHELDLPAFYVARYPITNAQYRPFVEGGGYDEPRYWTEEGWAWRTGEREPDLSPIDDEEIRAQVADWLVGRPVERRDEPFWWNHPSWGLSNRPVVGVTWYEALAYCRWLTERLQVPGSRFQVWRNGQLETLRAEPQDEALNLEPETLTVELPSEAEWEKAARGADGRRWPWGDEWSEGRANTGEANIEETSAVGAFPGGASPWRAMDMAGNVWEWTRSRWGRTSIYRPDYGYPYDSTDGREDLGGPDLRVLRGGSWYDRRRTHCASRDRRSPDDFFNDFGFRVVLAY